MAVHSKSAKVPCESVALVYPKEEAPVGNEKSFVKFEGWMGVSVVVKPGRLGWIFGKTADDGFKANGIFFPPAD